MRLAVAGDSGGEGGRGGERWTAGSYGFYQSETEAKAIAGNKGVAVLFVVAVSFLLLSPYSFVSTYWKF
jgi:hypothetical protein